MRQGLILPFQPFQGRKMTWHPERLKRLGLFYMGLSLAVLSCVLFTPGHCLAGGSGEKDMAIISSMDTATQAVERRRPASSQLIVVRGEDTASQRSSLYALEKNEGGWQIILGPVQAMTGRNGVAAAGEKHEGDGRTPPGIFPLGFVFGYGNNIDSRMPYRQMTPEDVWVDDTDSPEYNILTKKGKTTARSYEEMVLPDDRYKYGIVVEYNTGPVVAGAGSAIFIHVWKDENIPTSGCVALSEENILKLIGWLDPAKKPLISIGD